MADQLKRDHPGHDELSVVVGRMTGDDDAAVGMAW